MTIKIRVLVAAAAASVVIGGCSVKVNPELDTSLGMEAFEKMGAVEMRDASVALYIEPNLKDLVVQQNMRAGEFSFGVGRAFSAKLVKAMAYNFRTVRLTDSPGYVGDEPVDAVMRVSLQDVDVTMGAEPGLFVVSATTYSRLAIRAEILDAAAQNVVWVGTTQATHEGSYEEMGRMQYQEAGRGFAAAMSVAIDQAVGDLLGQMRRSASLQSSFARWELAT